MILQFGRFPVARLRYNTGSWSCIYFLSIFCKCSQAWRHFCSCVLLKCWPCKFLLSWHFQFRDCTVSIDFPLEKLYSCPENQQDLFCPNTEDNISNWTQGKEEVGTKVSAPHLQTSCCYLSENSSNEAPFTSSLRFWRLGFQLCRCLASILVLPKVCDCSLGFFCRTEFINSVSPQHQSCLPLYPQSFYFQASPPYWFLNLPGSELCLSENL